MYRLRGIPGIVASICTTLPLIIGCGNSSWHSRMGWEAEDYFEDSQVIALCEAIEADDLEEIERLVAAGVDVNARGKGNMTPLLWAFPDNKIERFQRLLEHGADPNVHFTDDFDTGRSIQPGYAITHMAFKSRFEDHYKLVLKHGGDPNLPTTGQYEPDYPIHMMITARLPDKMDRLQALIKHKVDLNSIGRRGLTPAQIAVSYMGQYRIALGLLKAGADPWKYDQSELQTVGHRVLVDMHNTPTVDKDGKTTPYGELINWLKENAPGLLETAKDDRLRRKSYKGNLKQRRAQLDREIAERKAREAAERENQTEEVPIQLTVEEANAIGREALSIQEFGNYRNKRGHYLLVAPPYKGKKDIERSGVWVDMRDGKVHRSKPSDAPSEETRE